MAANSQAAATLTELPRVRTTHYGLTKTIIGRIPYTTIPLPRAAEGFLKQQQL